MKKKISLFLAIAVFCTAVSALLAPITAEAATASILYENDFESSIEGWTALGTSNSYLSRTTEASYGNGSYSLKLAHHYDTWYSPQFNLYPLMKAMGPGTYAFTADVMADGSFTSSDRTFLMIRGASSADENSFIKQDGQTDNYFKRISEGNFIKASQWHSFTGSVKVLASDLTRDTGNFMFCVDGIPDGNINVYMDNVRIWRLSDEGITNGTFSEGLIGWRAWEGDSRNPSCLTIDSSLFANYIRVSKYSSIACNVDQIFSYYGPGRYTLSFSMRLEEANEYENPFIFYLTSNFSQYHQWMHQQVITPNSGWQAISIPLTIDATTFALLNPDEKEVHFRIQCPEQDGHNYYTKYCIDNVSLTPAPVTALGDLPEGEQPMAVGQQLQLPSPGIIPNYTPGRLDWYSSDPSIATVNSSGVVSGHAPGTVTITAKARSGGATTSCTVAVKQVVSTFIGYGQERPHYCWLACAKSLAHTYALEHSDVTFNNVSLQAAYDATKLPEPDGSYEIMGDPYDIKRAINYFLNRSNYEYNCLSIKIINSTSETPILSESEIVNLLNQNTPIIMDRFGFTSDGTQIEYVSGVTNGYYAHSVIIYGYYYKNSTLMLEIFDPNGNNRTGSYDSISYISANYEPSVNNSIKRWTQCSYMCED